jgi:hypothetical protein
MMMRSMLARSVVFAASIWLGLSVPALAQGVGAIGGTVTDPSGAILPGVTLTLTSPGLIGSGKTTLTDGQGAYEFTRLVPGQYSVKAELQGFKTAIQTDISVNADRTARADVKLAIGSVEESVKVEGLTPLLDTTSALEQTELTRQFLDTVPTGHDVWSITGLAPAVINSSIDVGGRGMPDGSNVLVHGSLPRDQGYLVDGFDVTSPQESSANLFFDTFVAQEINVQAGQTPAEQPKSGVLMNMITKTGTNRFSGSAMFEGTNSSLESDNVSGNPTLRAQLLNGVPAKALAANPNLIPGSSLLHLFDSAATIGGPIVKDRLWFFASTRYGATYRHDVGDYNADGSQLLDDNTLTNLFGKVSWAATRNSQLHSLITWERKFQGHTNDANTTQFTDEQSTKRNDARVWVGTERWTQVLSPKLLLDLGGAWQAQQNDKPPQPGVLPGTLPKFDSVTQTVTQASPTYSLPTNGYKQQFRASMTYVAGAHEVKAGYQWVRSERDTAFQSIDGGLQAIYANGVPTQVKTFNTPTGDNYFNLNNAVFIQDKWRATRQLTLNLGLRAEHEHERINDGVSQVCQQANAYIASVCFPAIDGVPNWNFVSPRFSAIYDVFNDGRTALKFTANRYKLSQVGLTDLVNPIRLTNDTRPWTVCAPGQTSGCDLNGDLIPQVNELGPSTGYNLGTTNHIDPNVKVPHQQEIAAEIEQQLRGQLVFSAGYHYRGRRDIIGAANLAVPTSGYTPITATEVNSGRQVTVYNQDLTTKGQFNTLYTNRPELNDSYHGVDFVIQKRMSNHWMLMASLTVEKTDDDINTNNNGQNTADLNNPNFQFRRGPASTDTPVFYKINGAYELPYGLRVAADNTFYRGAPTLTTVQVTSQTFKLTQGNQTIAVTPFGTTRLPNINTVNVNIARTFKVGQARIEPQVSVFNLFNTGAITSEVTLLGPSYGNAVTILGSRLIKFGANITF